MKQQTEVILAQKKDLSFCILKESGSGDCELESRRERDSLPIFTCLHWQGTQGSVVDCDELKL